MLTWDLTIFGNTIRNKDRGEVIPRTWFHSFFSRKKSEIRIAFTFFEKWKVKNKIPSLFFEKWKWNWNGSRSRTRSENEKKFSRILEKRESRWSLPPNGTNYQTFFYPTFFLLQLNPTYMKLQISAFFLFSNFRKRQIALYSPCRSVGRLVVRLTSPLILPA